MLKPQITRTELGRLQILAIFKTEKKEMIVGGRVMEGKVKIGTKVKVIRGGETLAIGDLKELKIGKQKVAEAVVGEECGMQFIGEPVIAINDTLEVYLEETKEREIKKIKAS
jgi:translation initiation factor IF-2